MGQRRAVLDDNDGALTAQNASSPYYPSVVADLPARLLAWWEIISSRAVTALTTGLKPITQLPPSARVIELPEDIIAIRNGDQQTASKWRLRVREQFQSALAAGLDLIGLDADDSYIFAPKGATNAD